MKSAGKYISLFLFLGLLTLVSLMAGGRFIPLTELLPVFFGQPDSLTESIVLNLRLPRIGAAFIAGAALSVSGAVFQSVLRNPLADPYILGVSGGAALGAAAGIIILPFGVAPEILAFAGSIMSVFFIEMFSRRYGYGSPSLILSGISMSFVISSAVMLLFCFAKPDEVHKALMWLMGDLSIARYSLLGRAFAACLFLILIIFLNHKSCDIISFGKDFSLSTGVSENRVRFLFIAASLLAAVSVLLAGVIGFAGLIVPHLFRYIFGANHVRLIPLSAVGGGVFLMLCDALGRSLVSPYEIPAGVITCFFGGIFFLAYMFALRRRA
ncbi:MAG: iron ABC transporter permease [Leptospirales bacterium]|nr:iron ABC transporter permease [Leptospirales bacterium]